MADTKKAKTIPKPETKIHDFGKMILPSENLAAAQKIIETAKPITRRSPFEVSIGIFVKGKKKTQQFKKVAPKKRKSVIK